MVTVCVSWLLPFGSGSTNRDPCSLGRIVRLALMTALAAAGLTAMTRFETPLWLCIDMRYSMAESTTCSGPYTSTHSSAGREMTKAPVASVRFLTLLITSKQRRLDDLTVRLFSKNSLSSTWLQKTGSIFPTIFASMFMSASPLYRESPRLSRLRESSTRPGGTLMMSSACGPISDSTYALCLCRRRGGSACRKFFSSSVSLGFVACGTYLSSFTIIVIVSSFTDSTIWFVLWLGLGLGCRGGDPKLGCMAWLEGLLTSHMELTGPTVCGVLRGVDSAFGVCVPWCMSAVGLMQPGTTEPCGGSTNCENELLPVDIAICSGLMGGEPRWPRGGEDRPFGSAQTEYSWGVAAAITCVFIGATLAGIFTRWHNRADKEGVTGHSMKYRYCS
eukprot:Rhum_TRINITY_DN13763_c3_g1::Rhum_TRINITY_DN13763_c3_g1_i1::g.63840::m.63840